MLPLFWSLLVFGTLLALAALAAEQARWLVGASRRLPWLVALIATALWPLVQSGIGQFMSASPAAATMQLPMVVIVSQAASTVAGNRPWLVEGLAVLWGLASLVLLARLVGAARAATAALRTGKPSVIDGAAVILSDATGPAVVGWMQPQVLWPGWLADVEPSLRRLILRHEHEHCRANDPRWVLAAECAVVLMPLHPAVWWMRHRLRAAIELDCDSRVLSAEGDASRYGRLLMLLAQRQSSMRLASMLAEPQSLLCRRILTITTTRPRHSHLRAVALSLAALAAIVTACSSALNRAGTAPAVRETSAPAQAVPADPSNVYFEYQVDAPVRTAPGSDAPRYPAAEKAAGIEGEVLAQFVVGPDGLVESGSFRALRTATLGADGVRHSAPKADSELGSFETAVRDALPTMRFLPAKLKGVPVRQLVQQPFVFAIMK